MLLGIWGMGVLHFTNVRISWVLLVGVFLSSCVHTAISPVANPEGVPVVVRVPGARPGQKAPQTLIAAINAKVDKELAGNSPQEKPDPGIIGIGTVGIVGDMKKKGGEEFVGYAPMIVIRSTYPAETVDRATALTAAAYYRAAKKHFQLIPVTELASKPQAKKP